MIVGHKADGGLVRAMSYNLRTLFRNALVKGMAHGEPIHGNVGPSHVKGIRETWNQRGSLIRCPAKIFGSRQAATAK